MQNCPLLAYYRGCVILFKMSMIGEIEMTKRYKGSFISKVRAYVQNMQSDVVLRSEINALGEPRQVSRALRALVDDGMLIKIGLGVYAIAETSQYINKPIIKAGFANACIQALNKLDVKWEPGKVIKDYNEGRSQQVPVQVVVRLKSRCRRQFSYRGRQLIIERKINAK